MEKGDADDGGKTQNNFNTRGVRWRRWRFLRARRSRERAEFTAGGHDIVSIYSQRAPGLFLFPRTSSGSGGGGAGP